MIGFEGARPPLLPQFDPQPSERNKALEHARETWSYDAAELPGLASTKGVPKPDEPSAEWLIDVGKVAASIAANEVDLRIGWVNKHHPTSTPASGRLLQRLHAEKVTHHLFMAGLHDRHSEAQRPSLLGEVEERIRALHRGIQPAIEFVEGVSKAFQRGPHGRPESFGDYRNLFATLARPDIVQDWQTDETFAWLRLAGPNPRMLQGVQELPENLPLDQTRYAQSMPGDVLEAALEEGRIFLCDYAVVGRFLVPHDGKTVSAPLALFALTPEQELRPVAIQCAQEPHANNPIFIPADGLDWGLAKSIVQVADANYHELIAHLGRTHLTTEVVLLATRRHLAPNHPLTILLAPHFEGTVFINHAARTNLIAPGGAIDTLFAGTIESAQALATEGLTSYDFMSHGLPAMMQSRQNASIVDYPYRDDALLVWKAIQTWVTAYVRQYYPDAASLRGDAELTCWNAQLQRPIHEGGLPGFPTISTPDQLAQALTQIIFVPSAQHAAVNFPQRSVMSYAPAISGAGWTERPQRPVTAADRLDFLPPLELARQQLDILGLLGGVYHSQLGDYRSNRLPYGGVFVDPHVRDELLPAFRADLQRVETTITTRNLTRARPYPHLLPSKIPMSINI